MRLILQLSAAASLSLCISLGTLSRTVLALRPPLSRVLAVNKGPATWSLSIRDTNNHYLCLDDYRFKGTLSNPSTASRLDPWETRCS